MSDNTENLVLEILKSIQVQLADQSRRLDVINAFVAETGPKLERLEDLARRQRRDTAGLLVMAKAVSGDFAEEIADLQKRVDRLEAQPS